MEAGPDLDYARTGDGVTIAYQVLGRGPAVVWLPSLGNLRAQWRVPVLRAAYEHLARSVTLVLYDGRGMGSSDRRVDPGDLGLAAHLRDLDAVLTAAGLESTALLGYYHSTATAIAFAAERPQQVTRMILFGGSARIRDAMSPAQTQALLSLVDQDWDLFVDTAAHAWLGWGAGESGRLVADAFRTAAAPAVAKAWFAAAADIDVTDRLPDVVVPTLVLHRQGERQIPVEVSRRLADALPRGRLVELAGSSPTLFVEDARADLDLVTRFLTSGDVVPPATPVTASADGVTDRELDVLRLLAAGDSNAEIARSLGITVHTVERHTANLYRKIGARGRTDATAYAVRRGIA
ncbi:alpha/beta fold hydrolase [Pseudonocardia asaccharolytica]|uniref:LuxR family transcriptional regulator n=1 Tax=Pseudonocardia asaccharolytica DSM 44247 = NBRC 16224 TaxID=1123024 RepID=A0A511CVI8_9PSEU|nr:alpha/beta fold hydrolase [Pseudonocardia asaccharolytica]GEL16590.1 LuxR family transcriptional regulator [Pseudonocardia asaccharolytica DSM 44247 = NBRC 16224]